MSSVTDITRGVKELEEIQSKIHFTALNARVETARLGGDGAALKVLGGEVQDIAHRSKSDTEAMLVFMLVIDKTIRTASKRHSVNDGSAQISCDVQAVRRELSGLSQAVVVGNKEISKTLETVLRVVDLLGSDLRAMGELADRGRKVTAAFDGVLDKFDRMAEQLGLVVSADGSSSESSQLASLYSMDSERRIHEHYFGGQNTSEGDTSATSGGAPDSLVLDDGRRTLLSGDAFATRPPSTPEAKGSVSRQLCATA